MAAAAMSAITPTVRAPDAYLFAHMTKADYGRLYYSVSEDGLHWRLLHGGRRVFEEYRGHPELCRGPDARWWLVGVGERDNPGLILYESRDLVTWKPRPIIPAAEFDVGDHIAGRPSLGAPKLYYDDKTALFYLTWHASIPDLPANVIDGVNEARWSAMRTFVMTSRDLATFSKPQRLFPYDMATIDVILRREGDTCFAILKDERYPTFEWPTGKSIRIASAPTPLGPWSEPSAPISPNYHEAPTVIPRKDGNGWLMYHEQYPGIQYGLSTAPALAGPWHALWIQTYAVPVEARHGCMVPITSGELAEILRVFDRVAP